MASFSYDAGTILRFRGEDGKNVHMGFVFDATRVISNSHYGKSYAKKRMEIIVFE